MNPEINRVLDYWFGPIENGTTLEKRNQLWFGGEPETDEYIRNHFEALVLQAERGELNDWTDTPRGTLALIILLDQFPLNMYRQSARAYDFEAKGLATCLHGLREEQHLALSYIEKVFFYLPLEHSENADHQKQAVALYLELKESAPDALQEHAQLTLDFAIKHKDIIDRFGHFPHRNAVLGRPSTAEEIEFLQDPSNRFGQ